jgi:two-component system alkaline phosphatase synthesis response regulator PhoP
MKTKVLLIEDDPTTVNMINLLLNQEGKYVVHYATNIEEATPLINSSAFDLLILGHKLSGEKEGVHFLEHLRYQGIRTPVIVLGSTHQENEVIQWLEAGADDFILKSFGIMEFLARILTILRRARHLHRKQMNMPVNQNQIIISSKPLVAELRGEKIAFRRKEFELFITFAKRPGVIFSRAELLHIIWGGTYQGGLRTVDVHVSSLRKRLALFKEEMRIESVRGSGYRFTCSDLCPSQQCIN